jgi:23S rRNA pseudouridine955/2504/2580 synthase
VRVQSEGMASHTIFNRVRNYGNFVLLEAELLTGRTHQIRVHLASSGFPIAGDDKYGDFDLNRELAKSKEGAIPLKRMFLHAHQISFVHPGTGAPVTLNAPLPQECTNFLSSLSQGETA